MQYSIVILTYLSRSLSLSFSLSLSLSLSICQAMADEMCFTSENVRRVLEVERRVEGGCSVLLDKDQTLLREGWLACTHTCK